MTCSRRSRVLAALLLSAALLAPLACSPPPLPNNDIETVRADLGEIPPPTKSRYLTVKTLETWQNPYLTVQGSMVTLHVTLADANTTDLGVGGLMRPIAARHQALNVRLTELPAALEAVPHNAWPYGRVVAVEEAHDAPRSAEPQLRRNLEASLKSLTDCGVVAYEWQEGGTALK